MFSDLRASHGQSHSPLQAKAEDGVTGSAALAAVLGREQNVPSEPSEAKRAMLGINKLNSERTRPLEKDADNRHEERTVDSYFLQDGVMHYQAQQQRQAAVLSQFSAQAEKMAAEQAAAISAEIAHLSYEDLAPLAGGSGKRYVTALPELGTASDAEQDFAAAQTYTRSTLKPDANPTQGYHKRIVTVLANGIFRQWLQRRTLQLQHQDPLLSETTESVYYHTAMLLLQDMVFAMRADGKISYDEQMSLVDVCLGIFHDKIKNIRGEIDRMLTIDLDPESLVRQVKFPEENLDLYLLAAVMLDCDHFLEQGYLENLAACLGIDPSLRKQLTERAHTLVVNEYRALAATAEGVSS